MGAGQKVRSSQGALSLPEEVGETFHVLLVQYTIAGCFHFFKTAAVCSGDIEITL